MKRYIFWLIFAAALLIRAHAARAAGPVCRVVNDHPDCSDMGTGTLVDARLVLTCRHVFDDGVGNVWVRFDIDGKPFRALAEIVARDDVPDMVLLKLDRDVPCDPVKIGPRPKPGDRIEIRGYGTCPPWPGTWRSQWGTVDRDYFTDDGCHEYELTVIARSGDSGGPIFNESGELCLCVWGCNGEMPANKRNGPIRSFAHSPIEFIETYLSRDADKVDYELLRMKERHKKGCN